MNKLIFLILLGTFTSSIPVFSNEHLLTPSNSEEEYFTPDIFHENNSKDDISEIKTSQTNDMAAFTSNQAAVQQQQGIPPEELRVLAIYTDAAQREKPDIVQEIQQRIDTTNQILINSRINSQLKLAYVGVTSYVESDPPLDILKKFFTKDDGVMDFVHQERDLYAADICVLFNTAKGSYSRILPEFSEKRAFSVIFINSPHSYTFAHEIGHILGCEHDTLQFREDYPTDPLQHGHGYVDPGCGWRTIMSYRLQCGNERAPRIPYFSNPNVFYHGEATGTSDRENCASVWNKNSNTVARYKQPKRNISLSKSVLFSNPVAKDTIRTKGVWALKHGHQLIANASKAIILNPGFSTEPGASLDIAIEKITDTALKSLGLSEPLAQPFENTSDPTNESFTHRIYPNPSDKYIHIDYTIAGAENIIIELLDMNGTAILATKRTHPFQGDYKLELDVSSLIPGLYIVRIRSGSRFVNEKIIVH